ncbi:BppU family phage baseplate upper protein [Enterococcus hirae]|uniref:BppU family phage baseplate upper protein n=1 Tax=Enterococcus hirae TaxID=1354 RepID=UPI002DB5E1FB|nr:BppU family phage baseplate upper protein [Enterococcus hirae]MEB7439285.1 BppU family phage baseplate upper protein [Enterococcus hirae]
MANSLYNLALDFSKELNYTKAIMARQGDKGITVTVKPFLNGLQMDTSGGTFTLKGTTPSNRYVDSVATSVTSEEVTFSLDGTFMSEAGYYKHCYVEYRKDNQILTTQDIIFFSLGVSDISQGQADEYVSQLEELIRKYNETFDAFMAEIKGRVNSLNKQITDLTGQAKTLQDKLDALKEEISKLGNLQVMYSNSIDFGNYDYSGNPNVFVNALKSSDFNRGYHGSITDVNGMLHFTSDGTGSISMFTRINTPQLASGKTYTLSAKVRFDEGTTGAINKLRLVYRTSPGEKILLEANNTNMTIDDVGKEITIKGTANVNYQTTNLDRFYLTVSFANFDKINGGFKLYDIKIEEGPTATPYQPNLLDAPYYLSKVALGENIADSTVIFPIKTSAYRLYGVNMLEEFKVGQRYTLTMKANKPVSQTFWAYNGGNISLERMTPVEGLVDVWSCSFTPLTVDTSSPRLLSIYQAPQSTVGTCQIDWLKIEKGDTRTPNIEQYKYRGIGMRDSNNPKDYVWDLAPEYVEAEVTKKVAQVNSQLKEHVNDTNNPHEVTKNQVGLGNVDNFSTATQTEAEKGEASNKFMTPQRTTQMITKRIATDAEVVAGTDLNKLVTPKSLDIYYRDRTQVAVASYGTEDIALTAKEELSEASWRYRRIGDIVEFYGRFKLKEATDIVNVHELPTGFRLSTDFDDTSWNVPLNIQKAANPTSYVAGAFVERQGTNLLRVGGNSSGNHYVSGWWYTDDPFPTG